MKVTCAFWIWLLVQTVSSAPFFPEYDEDDVQARTHGHIKQKKKLKQQLLCSVLGSSQGQHPSQGRTFDLLGLGGNGGGGSLCGGSFQGGSGSYPVNQGVVPGAGSFPGGGGILSPVGGLLSEQQEILSSLVGLVGAVTNAGTGVVSGVVSGVRPQRYLQPIYRSFRPFFRFI